MRTWQLVTDSVAIVTGFVFVSTVVFLELNYFGNAKEEILNPQSSRCVQCDSLFPGFLLKRFRRL